MGESLGYSGLSCGSENEGSAKPSRLGSFGENGRNETGLAGLSVCARKSRDRDEFCAIYF